MKRQTSKPAVAWMNERRRGRSLLPGMPPPLFTTTSATGLRSNINQNIGSEKCVNLPPTLTPKKRHPVPLCGMMLEEVVRRRKTQTCSRCGLKETAFGAADPDGHGS